MVIAKAEFKPHWTGLTVRVNLFFIQFGADINPTAYTFVRLNGFGNSQQKPRGSIVVAGRNSNRLKHILTGLTAKTGETHLE